MKRPYAIILIIAAALLALGIFKDLVIKTAVTMTASRILGTPVHIGGMSVGILKHSVRIKNLRIENPAGFPRGDLIDIREAGVDYDLGAILKGDLHLPLVILNLKQMTVVKNKDGKLNVDALKVSQQKKEGGPQKAMPMRIDAAVLNLEKVTVRDLTKNPPSVQTLDIGVHNKTYRNIKSAQQLVVLLMMESMKPTALKSVGLYAAASVLGVAFLPVAAADFLYNRFIAHH